MYFNFVITMLVLNFLFILAIGNFLIKIANAMSDMQYQIFVLTERQKAMLKRVEPGLVDLEENNEVYDAVYKKPK